MIHTRFQGKQIFILTIMLKLAFLSPIIGCSCYSLETFSLYQYDISSIIIALEVLEKKDNGYEQLVEQYRKDTVNWNKPYHPPLPPRNNYVDFYIKVEKLYKGSIHSAEIILRAEGKNSSCYWEPQIGKRFIMYLDQSINENGSEIIEVGTCYRIIESTDPNYDTDKKALEIFQTKKRGKVNLTINQKFILKGKFRKGKRHGTWKIYEPLEFLTDNEENRVLSLSYKKGKLLEVKQYKSRDRHLNINFIRHWNRYHKNRLKQ